MEVVQLAFDYDALPVETRTVLLNCRDEIRRWEKRTVEAILSIGEQLWIARQAEPRDTEFGRWREAEFGWSPQTALNFMLAYDRFGRRSTKFVGQASALYALSAGSCPDDVRRQFIERIEAGGFVRYREVVAGIERWTAERDALALDDVPALPADRFRCLVIDPPWPMRKIERDERPNQPAALDYPVMSLDEIAALPVPDLAADDGCHLYLWVTHRFLPDGLALFDAWGFRYQCVMTWVKNVGITPFSWMYSTEHVLFGRRGSLDLLRNGLRLDFAAKVTRHSAKPDAFYDRVIEASPGPRLELFARRPRDGFAVWGNEVPDAATASLSG